MEYLIAGACSVWFLAFVLLEERVGGAVGVALRLLGAAPFLVLLVLAWTDRFRSDALLVILVAILVSTTVESVVRWRRRRAHGQRQPG